MTLHQALFEGHPDALVVLDAEQARVLLANRAARRALWNGAETVPNSLQPAQADAFEAARSQVIQGSPNVPMELSIPAADGRVRRFGATGSILAQGSQRLVQLVLRDATALEGPPETETGDELARHCAELAAMNEQLREMSGAKSRFMASMSHEIRTPLNAINGFAELLADVGFGSLSDQQRGFVQHIIAAGQHLLQLINDIIDIAKVEAGVVELDLQPTLVSGLVAQTVRVIRGTARGKGVAVTMAPSDEELVGLADERRTKQALFNLLANAIRHSPAGSDVDVSIRRVGDEIEFAVTDQGSGIAVADQERVFEEFVRVGSAANRAVGAGLGLSLSRELIRLQGGRIGLDSSEGGGSRFWFTLPASERPPDEGGVRSSGLETSAASTDSPR